MCDPLTRWMIVMPGARITYRSSNTKTKSRAEYIMDSFTCSSTLHTCNADICPSVQSSRPDFKRYWWDKRADREETKRGAGKQSGHSEIHGLICYLLIECFSSMTTSSHLAADEELVWFSRPAHHHDNVWSTVRSLRYHYDEGNTSLNSRHSLKKNKRSSV